MFVWLCFCRKHGDLDSLHAQAILSLSLSLPRLSISLFPSFSRTCEAITFCTGRWFTHGCNTPQKTISFANDLCAVWTCYPGLSNWRLAFLPGMATASKMHEKNARVCIVLCEMWYVVSDMWYAICDMWYAICDNQWLGTNKQSLLVVCRGVSIPRANQGHEARVIFELVLLSI